jgi:hypothetical protein
MKLWTSGVVVNSVVLNRVELRASFCSKHDPFFLAKLTPKEEFGYLTYVRRTRGDFGFMAHKYV